MRSRKREPGGLPYQGRHGKESLPWLLSSLIRPNPMFNSALFLGWRHGHQTQGFRRGQRLPLEEIQVNLLEDGDFFLP